MKNNFFSQKYIKINLKNHFLKKYIIYKNKIYIYNSNISNSFKHNTHRIYKSTLIKKFYITTKTYIKLNKTKTLTPPFKTIYKKQQIKKKHFHYFLNNYFIHIYLYINILSQKILNKHIFLFYL